MPDYILRNPRVTAVQWRGDNLDEMRATFGLTCKKVGESLSAWLEGDYNMPSLVATGKWIVNGPFCGPEEFTDAGFREHFAPIIPAPARARNM